MTAASQNDHSRSTRPAAAELLLLLVITAVAVVRITSTYHVFTHTIDEPVHLASGMEWLEFHRLTWNRMHPPLSRVFVALGPYLEGVRWQGEPYPNSEGIAELHSLGHYFRTLTLARVGVLPFFVLAVWSTWWLARLLFGSATALVAAGSFTLLPPILAHAGLATTDMAITGIMPLVLAVGLRWLEHPKRSATILLGIVVGVAVLLKFSALVFIPACLMSMLIAKLTFESVPSAVKLARWRRLEVPALGVLAVASLTVWAGYLFHVGTLASIGLGALASPVLARAPILPAPEFWHGIVSLLWYNEKSIPSYSLGEVSHGGPWYFFPMAVGVKTPIGFLALALLGLFVTIRDAWQQRRWWSAIPAAAAVCLLVVGMSSKIAIGLRHVLPVYTVLSILAGAGAVCLWRLNSHRPAGRAIVVLLGAWLVLSSARAHPDYLVAFNELASARPEHFLIDSDLDWGQDVGRLADTVRARRIDSLTVYLLGFFDDSLLPSVRHLVQPEWFPAPAPTTGWVAASAYPLYLRPGIPWLQPRRPVARVGKSIYLFYIPP
jgi:hypothetical protein